MAATSPLDRRVVLVSGKGGTGKTTVAAALACAAARTGRRVLLAEVEGRHGLARLMGIPPPGFEERPAPLGFAVLEITAEEALVEYLAIIAGMQAMSWALRRARVTQVATEATPGFRDVMVAGKLYEVTAWRDRNPASGRRPYDLVVVDAPPTGQIVPFLQAPAAYRELIRVGRAARQLEGIDRLLRAHARVLLVAAPEEMAVAETEEAAAALDRLGFARGPILANRVHPPVFPPGVRAAALRLSPDALRRVLGGAGVQALPGQAEEVLREAVEQDRRVQEQRQHLARLGRAGPVVELPYLYSSAFGRAEVEELAGILARAGEGAVAAAGGPR